MQKLVLKFQLYGQATDFRFEISKGAVGSKSRAALIVNAVYQHDALTVVLESHDGFSFMLTTRRVGSKTMKNFETRVSATLTKLNCLSTISKLQPCLTALVLLSSSGIDDSQRVWVLAACDSADTSLSESPATSKYLQAVTYNEVASIAIRYDSGGSTLSTNSAAYVKISSTST